MWRGLVVVVVVMVVMVVVVVVVVVMWWWWCGVTHRGHRGRRRCRRGDVSVLGFLKGEAAELEHCTVPVLPA